MIVVVPVAELQWRGQQLMQAAAAETGSGTDVPWDQLHALQSHGRLATRGVEVDGQLVGYGCATAMQALWRSRITCTTLSVFVSRPHRGRWALPLLRSLAAWAREAHDAPLIVQAVPGSRLELLARRLGWRPVAAAYELTR